jgi:hypothetical protein
MTSVAIEETHEFQAALAADGRSPEIPHASDAYGFLIGHWELDVLHYWAQNVAARGLKGEVHAGWVLEGRAVQDVWIMPRRSDRTPNLDKKFNMYGTTLRVWDAGLEAWRITWSNPAGDHYEQQIGRRIGNDIVQLVTVNESPSLARVVGWPVSMILGDPKGDLHAERRQRRAETVLAGARRATASERAQYH